MNCIQGNKFLRQEDTSNGKKGQKDIKWYKGEE
jgi:hypothetical protein